jgi:hypothetical protein
MMQAFAWGKNRPADYSGPDASSDESRCHPAKERAAPKDDPNW